jgi:hypothetical protein
MRLFAKTLAIALSAGLIGLTAAPAFAGPAETAFLQKLTANWTGRGKLNGAQSGPVACRLVISGGNTSIKYQGRCSIPDMATQAFNGAISYSDKTNRYEIRSMSGSVPGIRRGNSLVFTTKDSSMGGSSYSTMTLSPSSLVIDFTIVDRQGEKTTSHISFSK